MKLDQMMTDFKKNNFFGNTSAGIYFCNYFILIY